MVTCVFGIFRIKVMYFGCGYRDYGWLVGFRVLMFLEVFEERIVEIRIS